MDVPHTVYHIEADLSIPGNLLYSDRHALRTTDGNITTTIAGSESESGYLEGIGSAARFNYVTGFAQISTYLMVLVDNGNNCLRFVNRITTQTYQFAGNCSNWGERFYPKLILGSNYASRIAVDQQNKHQLLVTNKDFLSSIRIFGIPDKETLYKSRYISQFIQDPRSTNIYVVTRASLERYDRKTNTSVILAEYDGSNELRALTDVVLIADNTFLLASYLDNKLIMLDLARNSSFSIFLGEDPTKDILTAVALSLIEGIIYVTDWSRIRTVIGK